MRVGLGYMFGCLFVWSCSVVFFAPWGAFDMPLWNNHVSLSFVKLIFW